MTNKELIAENQAQKERIEALESKLENVIFLYDQLKKIVYGAKRERFESETPDNQLNLFAPPESKEQREQGPAQEVTYTRKNKKKHPGRNAFPEHLPVEEEIIEPQEDTTDMVHIGDEVSETIEYTPASLYIHRIVRPKYAPKIGEGEIKIAYLPGKPIDKGIAGSSLLAWLLVSKFVDHMPFYRIRQQFKREYDWEVSSSTINDWFVSVCTLLKPLYDQMRKKILESGYIQADESYIKVQDNKKYKATHRGFQWVYNGVEEKLILFDYRKGRDEDGPKEFLRDYQGWLQADGYGVYDKIGAKKGIELVGCHVHARRKFFEAKEYDRKRAEHALKVYRLLYDIEKCCCDMSSNQRKEYRDEHSRPILEAFKKWLDEQAIVVLPKSPMGKAVGYAIRQWHKLIRVLDDGRLEMDNNLVENKIRPLALGRKNYLFAGSHDAAQRIAMMYSFFATCKANDVNPFEWLKITLDKIPDHPVNRVHELFPAKIRIVEELDKV